MIRISWQDPETGEIKEKDVPKTNPVFVKPPKAQSKGAIVISHLVEGGNGANKNSQPNNSGKAAKPPGTKSWFGGER